MPSLLMWSCVLQATLLCVASHAILVRLLDDFSMTVVPKEFQEAEGYNESETSFTPKRLTRWFVVAFFHSLLRYQWHIWLERALPTRPRGNLEAAQKANVTVELDEDKEEEVVKRWIAQGRVRRASVSWCNIILKWILLMLLGNFTACVLDSFVESAFDLRSITGAISKFQDDIILDYITSFFSMYPLFTFAALIIVPAPRRIVFEEGLALLWQAFLFAFASVIVPWALKFDLVQEAIRNGTEAAMAAKNQSLAEQAMNATGVDPGDEL